jgi:cbb3-type cytochrome oxidase maturation protein
MEVIYALIPSMIVIGLILVGVLIWAVKRGQYDDLEGDANRILMDDDDPLVPGSKKKDGPKSRPDLNGPDAD